MNPCSYDVTGAVTRAPHGLAALNLVALFVLFAYAAAACAAAPRADEKLEQRVNAVAAELRCLVCQNQSLADSNADLAVDLKNQIRDKMRDGASEADIISYMVARYGDFVLYRPPVKAATVLLWAGPFVLMVLGLLLLVRHLRQRNAVAAPLTDQERARAAALLAESAAPGDPAKDQPR